MSRINVTRSSMPSFEEYCAEIKDLWDSRWLTNMGEKHNRLQTALQEYLDVPHVTLYTNGHLALEQVLGALGLPEGGEVITTPFTFVSTTHAIARNGLVPVFCDIEPEHYTLDPEKIEALITEKTCAILPVHVYGNLCRVEEIQAIAEKHGLKVIYDAAHAFGESWKGTGAANFGHVSMFSFHATKVFHTIEGGAACFREDTLVPVLDRMKNFGLPGEDCDLPGGNAKMNEFQAAMGLCNLRHIDAEIEKRRAAALRYRQRLSGIPGIRLCPVQEAVTSNYAYFPVVFDGCRWNRDEIADHLARQDIYARKYFWPLTGSYACYRELPTADPKTTPVAAYVSERVLTLPLYADLSEADVDRICDIILEC